MSSLQMFHSHCRIESSFHLHFPICALFWSFVVQEPELLQTLLTTTGETVEVADLQVWVTDMHI